MVLRPRHDHPLPGWHLFTARCAAALARDLHQGRSWTELPALLAGPPPPPARGLSRLLSLRGGALAVAILKAFGLALVYLHLAYILATSTLILAYRGTDPSVTILMAYRKWTDGWRLEAPRPLPSEKIPTYQKSMLVAIEDDKFYEHHGIDLEAFRRAYEINSRIKRPLYGGSTLTMQVARTLFLVPVKSYLRKYVEVITAFELELLLPKKRILELYFGYAEWGKGIFGMEAAARHYYGRGLSRLDRSEAASLIALLSSPIRFNPSTLTKSLILRERYAYLIGRWVTAPAKAEAAAAAAAAEAAPPPPHVDAVDAEAPADATPADGAGTVSGNGASSPDNRN